MSHNSFRDPRQEFEEEARKQQKEHTLRILKNKRDRQGTCEHRYGSGPTFRYLDNPRNSGFCYLKLPTGEIIGVCLACQKTISSIDPADAQFFTTLGHEYATRVMPESIQAIISDDDKFFAQIARFTPEEQKRITKLTIFSLQKQVVKEQDTAASLRSDLEKERNKGKLDTAAMYEMPEDELKLLAEKELKKYRCRLP